MSRSRIVLPVLLIAGGTALLAVYTLPLSSGDAPAVAHVSAHVAAQNAQPACDLNTSVCAVVLADGSRGQIEISPRPIPPAQPLMVVWREPAGQAGHDGVASQATRPAEAPGVVELQFEGVEMDMGFNRARLTRQADGSYAGNAMLPVCTTGAMRWRARVERGPQRDAASIEFIAPQRP